MRIAVTGATGLLAEFLIPRLVGHDHVVHALTRSHGDGEYKFPSNERLRWFHGDLTELESLLGLVQGCDAVVHAALDHLPGRYRGGEGDDPARFRHVNLHQTEAFLGALQSTSVSRTVFISSRAVFDGYAESTASLPDATPPKPKSLYGEVKAQTEVLGNSLANIGFCTLRPTGIYGETHRLQDNKWSELISHACKDVSSGHEHSHQLRTEVHGDDVAEAITLLLDTPLASIEHRSFNCSDIAVSRAQLVHLMRQISRGERVNFDSLPIGIAPLNPMACDGLLGLGWQPGGMRKLVSSLRGMVAATS